MAESQSDLLGIDEEELRRRRLEESKRRAEQQRREGRAQDPYFEQRRAERQQQQQALAGRNAPTTGNVSGFERQQAAQIAPVATDQAFRNQQLGLAEQLAAQARGEGPSLAQMQLKQATSRGMKQALSQAASMRGGLGGAGSQRNLMRTQAEMGQEAAGQSAQLRLMEQQAAQQQLAAVVGQGRAGDISLRGQDVGLAATQAQLEQQTRLANQQALLQQAGFDIQVGLANLAAQLQTQEGIDKLTQFYVAQGYTEDEAQRQARMQADALSEAARQADLQRGQERYLEAEAATPTFGAVVGAVAPAAIGGAIGGVGSAIAASDERLKTDVVMQGQAPRVSPSAVPIGMAMQAGGSLLDRMPQYATAGGSGIGTSPRKEIRNAILGRPSGMTTGKGIIASDRNFKTDITKFSEPTPRFQRPMTFPTEGLSQGAYKFGEALGRRMMGIPAPIKQPIPEPPPDVVASERKFKIDVDGSQQDVKSFLDALDAFTYRYKDPDKFGHGRHAGVMAQDLEESGPIGESIVMDTPEGKMVDYGKAASTILAAQVELNDRLEKLEKKKAKKKK